VGCYQAGVQDHLFGVLAEALAADVPALVALMGERVALPLLAQVGFARDQQPAYAAQMTIPVGLISPDQNWSLQSPDNYAQLHAGPLQMLPRLHSVCRGFWPGHAPEQDPVLVADRQSPMRAVVVAVANGPASTAVLRQRTAPSP